MNHGPGGDAGTITEGERLVDVTAEANCTTVKSQHWRDVCGGGHRHDVLRLPGFILWDSFMKLSSSFISYRAWVVMTPPLAASTDLTSLRSSAMSSGLTTRSYNLSRRS